MKPNEEVLYGNIFKILDKYAHTAIDKDTKNNAAVEILATMIPVLEEIEKSKLVEKESETKKISSMSDILLRMWDVNDLIVGYYHSTEISFNRSVLEYAATHLGRWSQSKAWLSNRDSIYKQNLANARFRFIQWLITSFVYGDVKETLSELVDKFAIDKKECEDAV